MDLGITGRVALIAGGSRGLGFASASALASNGVRVALFSRTASALHEAVASIEGDGGAAMAVTGDVANASDCARAIREVESAWGHVDILVNNSGGPPPGTFETTDEATWQIGIDTTLMNVVRMTRAALPGMRARGWGRIVNITSLSAVQPIAGLLLSNALRGAVHGLSKTLSNEESPRGILVNCVCPGMHLTDRLRELARLRAEVAGTTPEAQLEAMARAIPIGRIGRPEELGATVAFLCSERASFITGTSIVVDGGASAGLT
ncbi:MAG: SDR family oxidoreductase [Phycisphaerales bacterium]|nr:SDR family oxidoreductase [Phycisphaerales bacterium]